MHDAEHLIQLLKTRRSVRSFKSDAVPVELIDQIMKPVCMRLAVWGNNRPLLWP